MSDPKKTTAPAPGGKVIKDPKILPIQTGAISKPGISYKASGNPTPAKGETVRCEFSNGTNYEGEVIDVTSADGDVLVELKDGLTLVD